MKKTAVTPIKSTQPGRRVLKVGPKAAGGIRLVLSKFKCTRDEKRVAEDLFAYFALGEERQKEIGYQVMTETEKQQLGIPAEQERYRYRDGIAEDIWTVDLSNFEWATLKAAMNQYAEWTIADVWEKGVAEQLDVEQKTAA